MATTRRPDDDAAPGPDGPPRGADARQHVVILSGLSGAGKTAATKLFEDLGYACVDNLPGELLPDLADLIAGDPSRFERVAVVLDVRAGDAPVAFAAMRGALEGRGIRPQVFFLEARDEALIRRYSETRHRHPLAGSDGIAAGIAEERRLLEPVRAEADVILDTSDLSLRELRERIFGQLWSDVEPDQLSIQLVSFGYKFGIPLEADLVLDVRFLQNPYYVPELRRLSGLTDPVRAYVLDQPLARRFVAAVEELLELTIPAYVGEGKTRLTIAIGCTGGYHRSIALAEVFAAWLAERDYGPVSVFHRELERR
ncbi:MAG: RNase adapter RapZ [Chloroflexi bacterium]|nr:RNase adapter RapZ [Chloroflexota bacterium]